MRAIKEGVKLGIWRNQQCRGQYAGLEEEILTTGAKELEMALVSSPHLAALVKQVSITYLRRPLCAVRTPALPLSNLLRSCPNVRRVEILVHGPSPLDKTAGYALAEEEVLPLLKVFKAARTSVCELTLYMVRPSTEAAGAAIADLLATLP